MVNTVHTHLSQNVFARQSSVANRQQPRSGVGQDNPTPNRARAASPQPAPPSITLRPQQVNTNSSRSQKRPITNRQTIHTTLHLKPRVRAELERVAHLKNLSVSTTGAALIEWALQQDLETQQGALLETIIEKAIGKHMRSYSNRLAVLLVRSLFAAEQSRGIVTNILGRQPGVTADVLTTILDGSSKTAKGNITRITPQLAELLHEVEQWFAQEEEKSYA